MNRKLPFEWIAAIRFLKEGSAQTLLTVVGAGMGVAVIVFITALMAGVQTNIFNRVLSSQAHIVITPVDIPVRPLRSHGSGIELATIQPLIQRLRSIDQWQTLKEQLLARPGIVALSPTVSGAALAVRGDGTKAVSLTGIVPADYYRISDIPNKITQGSADLLPSQALIGTDLSTKLGIKLGEKLRLRTTAAKGSFIDVTFVVKGIFDLGNRDANERSVFVPLLSAQYMYGLSGGVTALNINLAKPYDAEIVSNELKSSLGVNSVSWIEQFAQMFTALASQNIANFVISFFVGLAVALGIVAVMVVSVVQRSKEIGILRAMGATRGQILRVFLIQGAILGLISSVAGSLTGASFVVMWRLWARNPDGTEYFAIQLPLSLFVETGLVATGVGLLAAILPAVSAARLNPVDAIRG